MEACDVERIVDWARTEGWNPGLNDAAIFAAADPAGFFCAESNGEMAGGIAAVTYGEVFGFVGLFIVRPDLRGHRVGLDLAQRAVEHLGNRLTGIDGVLAKEHQYAKFFGFVSAGRNIRFEGLPPGLATAGLVPATEVAFDELAAFDRRHFPAPREEFLRTWISQPGGLALADRRNGTVSGYGVLRPCATGFKVGPLFADTREIAEEILLALCLGAGEGPVFLDTPGDNPAAPALARKFGMREVFSTTRMYRGGMPEIAKDGVFGVTSFELG